MVEIISRQISRTRCHSSLRPAHHETAVPVFFPLALGGKKKDAILLERRDFFALALDHRNLETRLSVSRRRSRITLSVGSTRDIPN